MERKEVLFDDCFFDLIAGYENFIEGAQQKMVQNNNKLFSAIDLVNGENLMFFTEIICFRKKLKQISMKNPEIVISELVSIYSRDREKCKIIIFYLLQLLSMQEIKSVRSFLCNIENDTKKPLVDIFNDLLLFKKIIKR